MVERRQEFSDRGSPPGAPAWAAVLAALIVTAGCAFAGEADQPIRLSEAGELGTFNVGLARAVVTRVTDPTAGGIVLKLDHTIGRGAAAGVYAKAFPEAPSAGRVNLVHVGVKAEDLDQSRQLAAVLELKGTAGVQRIPLEIHAEWAPIEEVVDWPAIGMLREVVVSVNVPGEGAPAAGTLAIDVRFDRLPALRKLSMSVVARIGGV